MKDVLLAVGTIVKPEIEGEETAEHMIIGKRIINDNSMKSWDYVAVPYPDGLKFSFPRFGEEKISRYENYVFFNHTDIESIVSDLSTLVKTE